MSRLLFWLSCSLIGWTYVGFPAVVLARGRLRPRPHRTEPISPSVSIVIAARNEEASIGAKLDNLAGLDYPADRLEVLIASDGSDDATNRIVGERAGPRVHLLALPRVGQGRRAQRRRGRRRAARSSSSPTPTACSRPTRSAALVEPFADPEVGGVAGDQRYAADGDAGEAAVAGGERSYWALDRALKVAESRGGHVISATGAIYAVRRSLFREVPAGVTDDFATSTGVIAQGRRLVFAPDAVAYEAVGATAEVEFARKVRVMTRGLNGVRGARASCSTRGATASTPLQLFSHKVLRRLMAVPLLVHGRHGHADEPPLGLLRTGVRRASSGVYAARRCWACWRAAGHARGASSWPRPRSSCWSTSPRCRRCSTSCAAATSPTGSR